MSQLYASKDIDGYLIECLKQPECYPHATKDIRVIESDLSWVILTGDFAYKIKKKIDLYYLDASTLARRKQLCEDEVRLNRRTFPELYLGTVSIAQKENGLCINGNGEVLEYAIQMQQFDPDKTLDKLHNIQEITLDRIESMVRMLVKFHEQAPIAGIETAFGEPNSLYAPVQLNFDQVRPCLTEPRDISQLVQLEAWANEFLKRLWPRFAERKDLGMIRECHGDAHLGNFVLSNDDCVKLFDCIEYRAEFRWIDVISEIAFLTVDLEARNDSASAWHLLNHYLELSGDYHSLWVFSGYKGYRAMVRAKECLLSLNAPILPSESSTDPLKRYRNYTNIAEKATNLRARILLITTGLERSTRNLFSDKLVDDFGLIRLRSDLERKRMFDEDSKEQITYKHLLDLSELILSAGFPVIVSGRFNERKDRERFQRLAESQGLLFGIITNDQGAGNLTVEELRCAHILDFSETETIHMAAKIVGHAVGIN